MPWRFCLEGGLGQRRCHHQMRFGVTSASWPWIPMLAVFPCFFPVFFLHVFIHAQVENPLDMPCHQQNHAKHLPLTICQQKQEVSLRQRSLCAKKPVLLVCSTNSKPMTSREMNSNATQPKRIQLIYIISASRRGWSSYYPTNVKTSFQSRVNNQF